MATVRVEQDPSSAVGGWLIHADSPAAIAAVPDAIVQLLGQHHDAATLWALHPSEQDSIASVAYQHERSELGPSALVQVVELARPRQHNVVWIDRYHLVARAPGAGMLGRILGLYAGSEGSIAAWVHHPSVAASFAHAAEQAPHTSGAGWADPLLVEQSRFAVRYDGAAGRSTLRLACATPFRQNVLEALQRLSAAVDSW